MILKRKKGFSLIETVLGISIAFMVIIIILDITIFFIKDFTFLKQETQNYSDIAEGLNYIDYMIKDRLTTNINVNGNALNIEQVDKDYPSAKNRYTIKQINNRVVVDYNSGTNNDIIKNVQGFHIEVKQNLAYIKVTSIKGESIERCFPIVVK